MVTETPNILIAGNVCIDRNVTEQAEYISWGSPAIYIADYCGRHDLPPVTISASYGPDLLAFVPAGVKLLPAAPNEPQTLRYENDISSGTRIQKCHNLSNGTPPAITDELKAATGAADIVIVAPLVPSYEQAYVETLLRDARPGTVKILSPQGYFRHIAADGLVSAQDSQELQLVLPLFDVVVYSDEDHPQAERLAHYWAANSNTAVIVTKGPKGATLYEGEIEHDVPTRPIPPEEILDSVGCGDVFVAALATEYWRSHDLIEAIKMANQLAGRKLRTARPVDSLPSTVQN